MGSQSTDVISSTYSPDFVASAFVERYYNILYTSPQHSHHFYQDISLISRPGNDGTMTTVTTMKGISEKLMSLDYKDSLVTIESVSAQGSASDGVLVGVSGFLTGKDNLKRFFSQTFFLAKQENGFFVLNDILHFIKPTTPPAPLTPPTVEEKTTLPTPSSPEYADNFVVDLPNEKVACEPETKSLSAEVVDVCEQSETVKSSPPEKGNLFKDSVEKVAVPEQPSNKNQKTKDFSSNGDAANKSYASILGKEKIIISLSNSDEKKATASAPNKQPQKEIVSPVAHPQGELIVPVLSNHHQNANTQGDSFPLARKPHQNNNRRSAARSIYVGSLPRGIDVGTLKAAAEEFGDVKQNGIQIVTYQDGFTFGFVEFESPESAQKAIEAHNITFGEKEAYIVYKRSSMQGGVSRGMTNNMNRRGDGCSYGNRNYNNNKNYNYYNNRG